MYHELIARIASHPRTQNFPVAGIAYNLILMRVAQNRAKREENVSTFVGNFIIESSPKTNSIPMELVTP